MDEWTVVRRGRPRDRPHPRINYPDQDSRDRPPRTYAEAVRSSGPAINKPRMENNKPRRGESFYPTRYYYNTEQRRPNVKYGERSYNNPPGLRKNTARSANESQKDTQLGQQIRKIYNLIRQVHHLDNVSVKTDIDNKKQPVTFKRLTDLLVSTIKPVSMTEKTLLLLEGNAKNWAYSAQLILEDHYMEGIQQSLTDLEPILTQDWRLAFEIAIRWSKRKFQRRLTEETIDKTEALIVSITKPDQQQQPHTTHKTKLTSTTQTQTSPITPRDTLQEPGLLTGGSFPPFAQVDTGTSPIPDHIWSPWPSPVVPLDSPKKQRKSRVSNPCVIDSDNPILDLDLRPTQVSTQIQARQSPKLPEPIIPESQVLVHEPIPEDLSTHEDDSSTEEDDLSVHEQEFSIHEEELDTKTKQLDLSSYTTHEETTATLPTQKPHRHSLTHQKMVEWKLRIHHKWVIMGDSNLSRISGFKIPDLQIESYPEAQFRHAEAILAKTPCSNMVEKIVLSFGLNNRAQKPKETAIKQIQKTFKKAKDTFPHAEIWIPLINYSRDLPKKEQDNLDAINTHIRAHMPYIPVLPSNDFHTEKDKIHWTPITAQAMLDHWSSKLNLVAH